MTDRTEGQTMMSVQQGSHECGRCHRMIGKARTVWFRGVPFCQGETSCKANAKLWRRRQRAIE